jgi:hypothetical protein
VLSCFCVQCACSSHQVPSPEPPCCLSKVWVCVGCMNLVCSTSSTQQPCLQLGSHAQTRCLQVAYLRLTLDVWSACSWGDCVDARLHCEIHVPPSRCQTVHPLGRFGYRPPMPLRHMCVRCWLAGLTSAFMASHGGPHASQPLLSLAGWLHCVYGSLANLIAWPSIQCGGKFAEQCRSAFRGMSWIHSSFASGFTDWA